MFDLTQIMEMMKVEPGHGLIQSGLLFMIWWTSRGVRKDLVVLKENLHEAKLQIETRFENGEKRLTLLEYEKGKIK